MGKDKDFSVFIKSGHVLQTIMILNNGYAFAHIHVS